MFVQYQCLCNISVYNVYIHYQCLYIISVCALVHYQTDRCGFILNKSAGVYTLSNIICYFIVINIVCVRQMLKGSVYPEEVIRFRDLTLGTGTEN